MTGDFSVKDRRVTVAGAARSGRAAAALLARRGARVTVSDVSPELLDPSALTDLGVQLELGGHKTETFVDADLVVLIYRDDVYNKDPNSPDAGTAELILAKQRNGPTGVVKLAFLREQTRFANLAPGGGG